MAVGFSPERLRVRGDRAASSLRISMAGGVRLRGVSPFASSLRLASSFPSVLLKGLRVCTKLNRGQDQAKNWQDRESALGRAFRTFGLRGCKESLRR